MEIKKNEALKINRYLLGVMSLIIVFQIVIIGAQIIRKEPPWTNVGSLVVQSCWFAICVKVHVTAQKKHEDIYKEYIKEEYARKQILNQCQKCSYYQGQIHGDNLLVCGIHPFGQEDCPDFELKKRSQ